MGGVNIPLPELDVTKPAPAPFPNALSEFQRASELQTAAAQRQGIQAQTTGIEQQNQLQAMQLKDMQTLRNLAQTGKYVQKDENGNIQGFDYDKLGQDAMAQGVNPQTVQQITMQHAQAVKSISEAGEKQLELERQKNKDLYEISEGIRDGLKNAPTPVVQGPAVAGVPGQPPAEQPIAATPEMMAAWHAAIPKLARLGANVSQLNPNQYPSAAQIDQFEIPLGMHAQVLADAETAAKTQEAAGKGAAEQAQAALTNLKVKGGNMTPSDIHTAVSQVVPANWADPTLAARTEQRMLFAQAHGDLEGVQTALKDASAEVGAVEKETNPAVQTGKVILAQRIKRAEQTITQGSPAEAGRLLADGSLTLSELKSRGTTPEFITQATTEAQKIDHNFNPQRTEAEFNVAKSPANLAFFGSAKSLTDKGGTLDQLAAAAKDIPEHQIPIFNSIDDAVKAATGSGPIAKYASLLVGVSDDYSKVMGGGQGSDSSRNQAFNLVSAKQSPEQKAAAIEGIRGAVGSQTKSRIGNNKVLQKMYGSDQAEPPVNDFFSKFGGKAR
jgi:hypothetical protein